MKGICQHEGLFPETQVSGYGIGRQRIRFVRPEYEWQRVKIGSVLPEEQTAQELHELFISTISTVKDRDHGRIIAIG